MKYFYNQRKQRVKFFNFARDLMRDFVCTKIQDNFLYVLQN